MVGKPARRIYRILFVLASSLQAHSQKNYTYVGRIMPDSFLVAWGTADGEGNTIGRSSVSLDAAVVEADGRPFLAEHSNWVEVTGLEPDMEYPYRILIGGREVGKGAVRTGDIYSAMNESGIAGTAPQRHFLLVEIERETLKITPLSSEPVVARDMHRRPIPMPIVVNRLE